MPHMNDLDAITAVLDEEDWTYEVEDDHVRFGFIGDSGSWRVFMRADDDGILNVDSILDQFPPESRRAELIDLLTRINWGKRIGGFQFDHSDGEIRYHTGIDVEGAEATPLMIRNLLYANLSIVDHYFGAIMAVCFAKVDALSALLALEEG